MGGGAVGDKYQILNFFRAAPNRMTFIFKTPPTLSRKLRTRPPTFNQWWTLYEILGGRLVPKARKNFEICIPKMAFPAFWEHIL
jgi:hypothetical protein